LLTGSEVERGTHTHTHTHTHTLTHSHWCSREPNFFSSGKGSSSPAS